MKYKNYNSAIHNFTHSFMSIDYSKSGRLAVNVLIDLYNLNLEPKTTFAFIAKTILPAEANTKRSNKLLNDYLSWLPDHFARHNCDLTKLEVLQITIRTDFNNASTAPPKCDSKELMVHAMTKLKADGRSEQAFEISLSETINGDFIKQRIPEIE